LAAEATTTASAAAPSRAAVTIALCALAALAEGFDIQSMGVAAPAMAPAMRLARDQLGPAFSASTLGLTIGAIAVGWLADRIGRKAALIGSLLVFGVFSLATPFAPSAAMLLAIRFAAGLGLGGGMPNLMALASEAVAERWRATFVAVATAAFPLGGAVASAIAATAPWQAIFDVGGGWPLVLAAVMLPALPESDRFQAARRAHAAEPSGLFPTFFGAGRARSSVLIWTAAFASLLVLFVMLNWLPLLMTAKGVGHTAASLISLGFNAAGAGGGLTMAALLVRPRRGRLLAAWFAACGASVLLLAIAPPQLAAIGAAAAVAGFFISSMTMALYALGPDVYPVEMRATGLGGIVGVGRLGAVAGPLLAGALLARGANSEGVLLALLPFAAMGAVAALALVPRRPRA
jgi:AAHS family 3-hydroxyphenylpropionic acid transporter